MVRIAALSRLPVPQLVLPQPLCGADGIPDFELRVRWEEALVVCWTSGCLLADGLCIVSYRGFSLGIPMLLTGSKVGL